MDISLITDVEEEGTKPTGEKFSTVADSLHVEDIRQRVESVDRAWKRRNTVVYEPQSQVEVLRVALEQAERDVARSVEMGRVLLNKLETQQRVLKDTEEALEQAERVNRVLVLRLGAQEERTDEAQAREETVTREFRKLERESSTIGHDYIVLQKSHEVLQKLQREYDELRDEHAELQDEKRSAEARIRELERLLEEAELTESRLEEHAKSIKASYDDAIARCGALKESETKLQELLEKEQNEHSISQEQVVRWRREAMRSETRCMELMGSVRSAETEVQLLSARIKENEEKEKKEEERLLDGDVGMRSPGSVSLRSRRAADDEDTDDGGSVDGDGSFLRSESGIESGNESGDGLYGSYGKNGTSRRRAKSTHPRSQSRIVEEEGRRLRMWEGELLHMEARLQQLEEALRQREIEVMRREDDVTEEAHLLGEKNKNGGCCSIM
eukprot:TRINITY_DN8510_c0_g1_i2.p1 TRINITY_DN8510_c0_g1~~TRINITY_DN8510_c0_g1_i2.p1  ORF type:complete len:443 (-),score=153.34 TRINITY_DN8510_c0_g1_i2:39-1367(-)